MSLAGVIAVTPSSSSVSGQSVNLVAGVALREIVHRSVNGSQPDASRHRLPAMPISAERANGVMCLELPPTGVAAMGRLR